MKRIGILGAGTWGTALANLLTSIGHEVTLWSRIAEEVHSLIYCKVKEGGKSFSVNV